VGDLKKHLRQSLTAFQDVFRNAGLRKLELAWAIAVTGWWAYIVAVSVFAYQAGGTRAVGALVLIRTLPAAAAAPFAASLADRYSRKKVIIVSNSLRGALIALAGVCVLIDAPAEIVYAIAGVTMIVATPLRPAMAAITPSLARNPEELTAANAVASTIESLGYFVGPALAGLLLAAADTGVIFLMTGAGFGASVLIIAGLVAPDTVAAPVPERRHIVAETMVGFRTVARDARLRILLGLFSAETLAAGALTVLVVVTALDLLEIGESGVGYLNAAFGVGALLGGIIALSLVGMARLSPPFIVGVALWGAPLVVAGIWPNTALVIVLLLFVGVGNSLIDVATFSLVQRAVPDEVLARVFGVIQTLWISTFGIGGLIAVPLIDFLGARGALIVVGATLPALVAIAGPKLLKLDAAAEAPVQELALLRSIPIFAPLPGTPLEHLATHMTPMRFEPGASIVQQGEAGDRFYVLVEGEADVSIDGQRTSQLGAGDYFGEIALLRNMPRTATVTARTPVVVYALERPDFLAAVTGHAPSADAAEEVVSSRLAGLPAGTAQLPA
jgi:MFS family permease